MIEILIALVLLLSQVEYLTYILAKSFFPRATRRLRSELWWTTAYVSGPIFLLSYLADMIRGDTILWLDSILWPVNVLVWWFSIVKDEDRDDRWKKRRKKVAEKVKEVAGKLVVVPVPSPT